MSILLRSILLPLFSFFGTLRGAPDAIEYLGIDYGSDTPLLHIGAAVLIWTFVVMFLSHEACQKRCLRRFKSKRWILYNDRKKFAKIIWNLEVNLPKMEKHRLLHLLRISRTKPGRLKLFRKRRIKINRFGSKMTFYQVVSSSLEKNARVRTIKAKDISGMRETWWNPRHAVDVKVQSCLAITLKSGETIMVL